MEITRREFHGHLAKGALIVTVAGSGLVLGGCGLAQDIENWVPVGIAALKSISLLLSTNGYVLSGAALLAFNAAIAALQALDNAAVAYGQITPPPATVSQELYDAFQVATQQIQGFLAALALPVSSLLNTIVGLAEIIFSTIMGFINKIPTPPPAGRVALTMLVSGKFMAAGVPVAVTAKFRKRHVFKRDWNATIGLGEKSGVYVGHGVRFPWMETI